MVVRRLINLTGVRSGDYLRGPAGAKQTQGVEMEVRSSDEIAYPPSREIVLLTGKEYRQLLEISTENNNLYLNDMENVEVRFIQIRNSEWIKLLGSAEITRLLNGQFYPISEVYHLFPRKPGSKAARHSLMFRPTNWEVMPAPEKPRPDYSIELDACFEGRPKGVRDYGAMTSATIRDATLITTIQVDERNIDVYGVTRTKPSLEVLLDRLAKFMEADRELLEKIREELSWTSPSVLKSLMQKIIRTRARTVGANSLPGLEVLLVTFTMLLHHSGIFNPRVQAFITGIESATKRLAVTIGEDSYLEEEGLEELSLLLVPPLVIRRVGSWFPRMSLIIEWWRLAWVSYNDKRMFKYRTSEVKVDPEISLENGFYYFLKEIGSFSGDIGLMSHIAVNQGQARKLPERSIIENIPFYHSLDHHNHTEIALYFPPSSLSFAERFKQIWELSSKINSRKNEDFDNSREFKEIRTAQELLWRVLSKAPRQERELVEGSYVDEYEGTSQELWSSEYILSNNWLSGLVGPIEIKNALVILHPDNPLELLVIKKPSRSAKTMEEFTPEEQLHFKKEALRKLIRGIPLKYVPTSLSFLRGTSVTRDEKGYYVNRQPWEDVRRRKLIFPYLEFLEPNLTNAVLTQGEGISEGAKLPEVSSQVLSRLRVYLGWHDTITLFPIDRQGEGSEYMISPVDGNVFHFLAELSVLYPAAIRLTSSRTFTILNGPLFWHITSDLIKISDFKSDLCSRVSPDERSSAGLRISPDERSSAGLRISPDNIPAWPHQTESVKSMIKRVNEGYRGNGIWIDPGMGKTRIFMLFLYQLIQLGRCPRLVVYTLPPSAVESIKAEFDRFQIPHQVLDMRKTGKVHTLSDKKINLIWHDHLRLGDIADQLRERADELLFVVDEFHLAMGLSLRTSIVLEIVSVSRYFVAMTGTIVRDNQVDHLIRWLAQLVDFDVNTHNYWVAVGALISKKVKLKIQVDRINREVEIPPESEYWKYVPEGLGGTATSLQLYPTLRVLYDLIIPRMVNRIKSAVKEEGGAFVVVMCKEHQLQLAKLLKGYRVHLIDKDNPIDLTPDSKSKTQVVITTPLHAAGYNVSKFGVMVTSVYLSNEANREQLEHRIIRISQPRKRIQIYTYYAGILTQIMEGYEKTRSWKNSLKSLADEVTM